MEVLTWKQLVARTGSPMAACWGIQHGEWVRVTRDAYVWADVAVTLAVKVAALRVSLPPGAAIGGRAALWLLGVGEPPEVVDVLVPRGRQLVDRAGCRMRSADLPDADLCTLDGQLLVSADRAGVDVLREEELVGAVVLVDQALRRGVATVTGLQQVLATSDGRRGVIQARRAAALVSDRSESPMETRLRLILLTGGLTDLVVQHDLYSADGHVGRVDLYVDGVAIEYDGRAHRKQDAVFFAERTRQTQILDLGVQLRRFTAVDVYQRPGLALVGDVRRAQQLAVGRDRSRLWTGPDTLRRPAKRPLPTLAAAHPAIDLRRIS